jgi:hypothetical protein
MPPHLAARMMRAEQPLIQEERDPGADLTQLMGDGAMIALPNRDSR